MRQQNYELASAKIDVTNLEGRSERIKLRFLNEAYQVNKSKNTVTSILDYEILFPNTIADTHVVVANDFHYYGTIIPRETFTSVGVSHCSENDVFDAEKGRRIAKAHAENKAYAHANEIVRKRLAAFDRIVELMHFMGQRFDEKTKGCIKHNLDYIERISE